MEPPHKCFVHINAKQIKVAVQSGAIRNANHKNLWSRAAVCQTSCLVKKNAHNAKVSGALNPGKTGNRFGTLYSLPHLPPITLASWLGLASSPCLDFSCTTSGPSSTAPSIPRPFPLHLRCPLTSHLCRQLLQLLH